MKTSSVFVDAWDEQEAGRMVADGYFNDIFFEEAEGGYEVQSIEENEE
jgi:hypothetical protein